MSPYRTYVTRKRRSDDESSDSSSSSSDSWDEDLPPFKKQRKCKKDTTFMKKCQNVFKYVFELPVSNYLKKVAWQQDLTAIDTEDDEIIVGKENTQKAFEDLVSEFALNSQGQSPTLNSSANGRPKPFCSSVVYYKNGTQVGVPKLTPSNESSKKTMETRSSSHKIGLDGRKIAPITNPGLDIEIMLDPDEITIDDDSDDLEIISESVQKKHPRRKLSGRSISPILAFDDMSQRHLSAASRRQRKGSSLRTLSSKTGHRDSTANEVMRLQEKAQYALLLDKMEKTEIYRPINKEPKVIAEVDLTLDEYHQSVKCDYTKESLRKPMEEFIKEYPLRPRIPQPVINLEDSSESDDNAEVIPIEEPEREPSRPKRPVRTDFFSNDWIRELKTKMIEETEKRMKIVMQEENKIKRFQNRREAKLQEEKRLFEKYKVPGDVFPDQSISDDFPELTPEMNAVVDSLLLEGGSPEELLSTLNGTTVRRKDIQSLRPLCWLTDEIINFYLSLIVERSKLDNYPTVFAFSTFFFAAIVSRGINSVLRWTRKVDIFSHDIVFVPLHFGMHWALCVVDNRSKEIRYYDSLSPSRDKCTNYIKTYLIAEMKHKKNIDMDPDEYSQEVMKGLPMQMNGDDCGMFTLKYAEFLSRDAPITFDQTHMPYFRRRMVYEILTMQIL